MPRIYKNLVDLIGKTPLLELTRYEKKYDLKATVIAKLEYTIRRAALRTGSPRP